MLSWWQTQAQEASTPSHKSIKMIGLELFYAPSAYIRPITDYGFHANIALSYRHNAGNSFYLGIGRTHTFLRTGPIRNDTFLMYNHFRWATNWYEAGWRHTLAHSRRFDFNMIATLALTYNFNREPFDSYFYIKELDGDVYGLDRKSALINEKDVTKIGIAPGLGLEACYHLNHWCRLHVMAKATYNTGNIRLDQKVFLGRRDLYVIPMTGQSPKLLMLLNAGISVNLFDEFK
jgi:hypothetical protein